jgi:hypothetical protein
MVRARTWWSQHRWSHEWWKVGLRERQPADGVVGAQPSVEGAGLAGAVPMAVRGAVVALILGLGSMGGSRPAWAEEAEGEEKPAPDAGWEPIPGETEQFSSALTPLLPAPAGPIPAGASGPAAPTPVTDPDGGALRAAGEPVASSEHSPKPLLRGRFGARPRMGMVAVAAGATGFVLGGSVFHQWWQLSERTVRPAGEARLDLSGRMGDLQGGDFRLHTAHGIWLGPWGLFGGGAVRWDGLHTPAGEMVLAPGLTVGPQLKSGLTLGPLRPWVGYTPSFVVAGPRDRGMEATWDAGLALQLGALQLRSVGDLRRVGAQEEHTVWQLTFGLGLGR